MQGQLSVRGAWEEALCGLLLPLDIMNISALEIQVGQELKRPWKMDISAFLGTFKAEGKANVLCSAAI